MRGRSLALLAGTTLACALVVRPGRTDELAPPGFQFVWLRESASGCPTPRQAREQVRRWLGRDPFTDDAEQVIEASVLAQGGRFHATVRVRDARGRPRGQRTFEASGPGCDAIARAALLAVVLTIDPTAPVVPPAASSGLAASLASSAPRAPGLAASVSASAPASAASVSTTAASAASVSAAASSAPSVPAAPLVGLAATASGAPAPVASPEPAPADRPPGRGSLAIGGGIAGRLLPRAGALASITGTVRLNGWLDAQVGALWLPLRTSDSRAASFGLTAARGGVCAAPLRAAEGAVEACAGLALGAMTAVVEQLVPVKPGSNVWVAATAGVRGRLELPGASFLRLGGEAMVPLRRLDYLISGINSRTVFTTPHVGGALSLEVGVHFL